jgi:hypothetical protein
MKYIQKAGSLDHVTPYNKLHIWLSSLSKALTLCESAYSDSKITTVQFFLLMPEKFCN